MWRLCSVLKRIRCLSETPCLRFSSACILSARRVLPCVRPVGRLTIMDQCMKVLRRAVGYGQALRQSLPRPFSTLFFGSAMCEMTDMATANDVTGAAGCIQMAWELKTRLACHVMAFDESNTIEQYLIRDDSHVTDAL